MSMSWEEIAESRMREIHRLREIVRCSTKDSFILEKAVNAYSTSKEAFNVSRALKAENAPLDESEIKYRTEMQAITGLITLIEIMGCNEFIEYAEKNDIGR